jgi:two-component system LytT family sensor kinase
MNKGLLHILKQSVLHLSFWFVVWFFFKTFFSVGSSNAQFIYWFSILLSAISIVASYVFVYNLLPNYLLKKKYKEFALYTFYAGVFITCCVFMTITFGFIFYFNLEFQKMPELTKSSSVILVCVVLIVVISSGIKILSHNYKSLEKNKSLENKILQAQLQIKEQELKFLKMQIHPHFLFNSLNTIYGFALRKKDEAPEMILKLSNLLDYILYQVDKPAVNLQDEIHHLEDYISLEEMRFHDTLNVAFQKKNINSDIQIAPMLLIPFVENSFKHGKIVDEKLEVAIDLHIENKTLIFEITNTSESEEKEHKGIGLENIQKRLEMLYPDAHHLIVEDKKNQFRIRLQISIDGLKSKTDV